MEQSPEIKDVENEPICRRSARYLVKCPECHRLVTLKVLAYTHVCRRSHDETIRAKEMATTARAKFEERVRSQITAPEMLTAPGTPQGKIDRLLANAFGRSALKSSAQK